MGRLKAFVQEPLVHFLLLGAGLFLAYGLVNRGAGDDSRTIVVTRARVEALVAGFTQSVGRPPTDAERDYLIREEVRDEVYFREAISLGLDRDDPVIRRHLRQKMEFLTQDVAAQAEPTDDELKAYLEQHSGSFGAGPKAPPLDDVRNAVRREWIDARRNELNEKAYQEILSRYSVRIEALGRVAPE